MNNYKIALFCILVWDAFYLVIKVAKKETELEGIIGSFIGIGLRYVAMSTLLHFS